MANITDIENLIYAGITRYPLQDTEVTSTSALILNLITTDTNQGLRDYFAAQALIAMPKDRAAQYDADMASDCYEIADTMLAAR